MDLRLHILPYFGSLRPDEITPSMVSSWVYDKLKGEKGLSSSSCDQILSTLRSILDFWIETSDGRILDSNPARARKMELEKDAAARDIPTDDEFTSHYDDTKIGDNWTTPRHGGSEHADPRAMFLGSLLASTTVMRIAEIQGLQLQHVHLDDPEGPWIQVEWQWDRSGKLIPPKGKRERGRLNAQGKKIKATKDEERTIVGLTKKASKWLRIVIAAQECTDPEDLVFHNHDGTKRVPWNYRCFERADHHALEMIGVDWKGRNIVFHSNRHYGSTVADEVGGEEVGRSMNGDRSKAYYAYIHKRIQRQRPVIDRLDELLNRGVKPELSLVRATPTDEEQASGLAELERYLNEQA